MPHTIVRLEQRLEPFVERFDRLTASAIEHLPAPAAVEPSTRQVVTVGLITRLNRFTARLVFRAAFVLRAQEATTGAFSFRRVFDAFPNVVAVITAIGHNILSRFQQVVDLLVEGGHFLGAGHVGRGQQGNTRPFFVAETTTSKL